MSKKLSVGGGEDKLSYYTENSWGKTYRGRGEKVAKSSNNKTIY